MIHVHHTAVQRSTSHHPLHTPATKHATREPNNHIARGATTSSTKPTNHPAPPPCLHQRQRTHALTHARTHAKHYNTNSTRQSFVLPLTTHQALPTNENYKATRPFTLHDNKTHHDLTRSDNKSISANTRRAHLGGTRARNTSASASKAARAPPSIAAPFSKKACAATTGSSL